MIIANEVDIYTFILYSLLLSEYKITFNLVKSDLVPNQKTASLDYKYPFEKPFEKYYSVPGFHID